MFTSNLREKGQTLLVLLLILSVILAVVVAASYRLVSETQTTQSQEESIRALAAADSGIEKGLQLAEFNNEYYDDYNNLGLHLAGIDTARSFVSVSSLVDDKQFVSPLIEKDAYFTFYLTNFPNNNTHYNGVFTLYFGEGTSCGSSRTLPAIEATLIYGGSNYTHRKFMIEPCTTFPRVEGSINTPANITQQIVYAGTTYTFRRGFSFTITPTYPNAIALILRPMYIDARLGFISAPSSGDFFSQGKTIKAEAQTISGVSKVISVFQSLPQLPAEAMITSF